MEKNRKLEKLALTVVSIGFVIWGASFIFRSSFIGVDEKNPLAFGLVDGKLFLVGKSRPFPMNDTGAQPGCNRYRPVLAERIHNHNFIGELQALETPLDVALFIPRYDDRR